MRKVEASYVVAYLIAAYPSEAIEDASFNVYVDALLSLPSSKTAKAAALELVKRETRFPSIAVFRSYYATEDREIRGRRAQERGLPEPDRAPPPPETVARLVEMGVITKDVADRLLKAAGGDDEQAARVAAVTKGA